MQALLGFIRREVDAGEYDEIELAKELATMAKNVASLAKSASARMLTNQERIEYAENIVHAVDSLLTLAVITDIPIQSMIAAKIVTKDYDTARLLSEAKGENFREPQTDIVAVIQRVRAECAAQHAEYLKSQGKSE